MNDIARTYNIDGTFVDEPLSDAEQTLRDARCLNIASANLISEATAILSETDKTMLRIQEAVTLGLTLQAAPDVTAFVMYRRDLRRVVDGVLTTLPSKVPYPQGT